MNGNGKLFGRYSRSVAGCWHHQISLQTRQCQRNKEYNCCRDSSASDVGDPEFLVECKATAVISIVIVAQSRND